MNELAILDAIQGIHAPWLDSIVAAYTTTGDHGIIWILLGICLIIFRRTRKIGVAVLLALAIGALITNCVLKPVVMRPRPCDVNPAINMIVPRPGGSSFPSGHTTAAFAAFGAILFSREPKSPIALVVATGVAAIIMAFTRLYAYVHYPTDVLAGAIVGLLAGLAATWIIDMISKRLESKNISRS